MNYSSLGIAIAFALHGYRRGSLSLDGAIAAFAVGYLGLARDIKIFGVLLLSFYLIGSRATKVKAVYKATLEETAHQSQGTNVQGRKASQVLCNSWLGTAAAIYWDRQHFSSNLCPLAADKPGWILLVTVFFYAACLGDTLSSELGILSKGRPRLITTLRTCPRGTNGGVSTLGLFVACVGGLAMGLVALFTLALEVPSCRHHLDAETGLSLLASATMAGLIGSVLDSILGATLQQTTYNVKTGRIVLEPGISAENTVISGYNILSNNGVNVVSSTVTALIGGYICQRTVIHS